MTTMPERASHAVEDALASDDNRPDDIARAVLMAVRGEVCDSVVTEFIDEVIGERPTEKNY